MHNDFTLFKRTVPSGGRIVYYYAYDGEGKRLGPWTTGETSLTAARNVCNRLVREIEGGNYEAHYSIIDTGGKERAVVFADQIDTREEAESRLEYDGGPFSYSAYDVTTHHDRAILQLHKEADGDVYKAAIFGRPIVLDLNRSCFLRDADGIAVFGTAALNITGSYFSEELIEGKPHYEDWVIRELAERIQNKKEFTVKTHRGLFNARVGAKVRMQTQREVLKGVINAFTFRYRKNEAFISSFKIIEEKGET